MRHLYAYFCCLLIDVAKYAKNKAASSSDMGRLGLLYVPQQTATPDQRAQGEKRSNTGSARDRKWASVCVCVCVSVGVLSSSNQ